MKTSFLFMLAGIAIVGAINEPSTPKRINKNPKQVKLTAGVTATQLKETKEFYQRVLQSGVSFENDFFILLHSPNRECEPPFLHTGHPSQPPIFQAIYYARGFYLTVDVVTSPDPDK